MNNGANSGPTVWLVAHGSDGEYESAALDLGILLLGFQDVPDLTDKTEEEIDALIPELSGYASNSSKSQGMNAGMMKAFAVQMKKGDVVASPLKTQQGQIALGKVTGDYLFMEIDGTGRHTRAVEWKDDTASRASFGADAFHYLVTKRTISRVLDPEVADKLRARLLGEGAIEDQADTEEEEEAATSSVEESIRDQIVSRIHDRFPGRKLEHLVAALLEAQGFVVQESDPGKDQGVDVLAGHGPLGFDHPRICVQVKHTSSRVSQPDIQQLHGAMKQFSADQGLFVSWSDYTSDAKQMARLDFFTMRLWNANDLLDAIYTYYGELPEDIQTEIPLKQIWTLALDESQGGP